MTENLNNGDSGRKRYALWIVVAAAIIFFDQLTKWAILKWVPLYGKVPINSFINITHHQNEGAAFSFLADAGGWQRWFFVVLALVVSAVLAVWLWRLRNSRHMVLATGLMLVLAGAIGNVADRIRLGYVVDFVQVMIFGWPFPAFNVADSAITVGAAFLIIDALFFSGREKAPTEPPSSPTARRKEKQRSVTDPGAGD